MAEIKLYLHDDPVNRQGFQTLLVGPAHPDYGAFCMGAGHGIGFNDQKTVEVRDLVDGIATDAPMWPDFRRGLEGLARAGCHRTLTPAGPLAERE